MSASPTHIPTQAPLQAQAKAVPQLEETTTQNSLRSHTPTHTANPLSGAFPPTAIFSRAGLIQPKLTVGPVDDAFEREADAVAEQVVQRMAVEAPLHKAESASTGSAPTITPMAPPAIQTKCDQCQDEIGEEQDEESKLSQVQRFAADENPLPEDEGAKGKNNPIPIQRKCASCMAEEELEGPVQRKCADCEALQEDHAPTIQGKHDHASKGASLPGFGKRLLQREGAGMALAQPQLRMLDQAFRADFSNVRIHTGHEASDMAKGINALAFTHGRNIYFREGAFAPHDPQGMRLLAHELTHTIQQGAVSASAVAQRTFDPRIQRACADLSKEFSKEELATTAGKTKLDQRIKECADLDMITYKQTLEKFPNSPKDHPNLEIQGKYAKLEAAYTDTLEKLKSHPNEANKQIKSAHVRTMLLLLKTNKLISYGLIAEFDYNITVAKNLALMSDVASAESLDRIDARTKAFIKDPEGLVRNSLVNGYYTRLKIERPTFASELTGNSSGTGPPPNAPPYPAEMSGPNTQARNSTGSFQMRLDYSIMGPDLLSQVVGAMGHVNYHWEIYDVTTAYHKQVEARIAALRAAAKVASGITDPTKDPTLADVEMEAMKKQGINTAAEVGKMAAAGRRWERLMKGEIADLENNWEDFVDPAKGADGTLFGTVSNQFTSAFNITNTGIAATFSVLGELLHSFADMLGGASNQKEVPFPDRDGWYLIRCIAKPSPAGPKDNQTIRPASVASKIVRVREIKGYSSSEVADLDKTLESRKLEAELNLKNTKDPKEKEKLEQEIKRIEIEQTGKASSIISMRIQWLKDEIAKTTDVLKKKRLQKQLVEMQDQLVMTLKRELELKDGTEMRPRGVFVSEETTQSYPLLFQLGELPSTGTNKRYRLSDVTSQQGENYEAEGATVEEAIDRAFNQFARNAFYGRGILSVVLPSSSKIKLKNTQFKCEKRGGAEALQRLENIVVTLTIIGLMAVPGVGEVAMVAGAAMAGARIYSRISNHSFKWDSAAVMDVLSILGAAAQGAATIGRLRVVRANKVFAVVADDVDVIKFIDGLNRTASRLELLSDMFNWGSFIYGNMITLQKFIELQREEMLGNISTAEARRQRASMIAGALKDGILQFATADFGAMKQHALDSLPAGKQQSPEAPVPLSPGAKPKPEAEAGGPKPPVQEPAKDPASPLPKAGDNPLPTAEKPQTPGDSAAKSAGAATVPATKLKLPPAEVLKHLGTVEAVAGTLPQGLRDLLMYDHALLKRAATDQTLITAKNKGAWGEIGLLAPMHADTYEVLLKNPELRKALIENPGASGILKHCASPCFPSNATPADVLALQRILKEREAAGITTDFAALNDFLYSKRGEASLEPILALLQANAKSPDFGGIFKTHAASKLVLPNGWPVPAPGTKSTPLEGIINHYAGDIPKGLLNEIFANMASYAANGTGVEMANLRGVLKARSENTGPNASNFTVDAVLYALASPKTHDFGKVLLERLANQPEKMGNVLRPDRLTVPELLTLHGAADGLPLTKDNLTLLDTIARHVKVASAAEVILLIQQSGYPDKISGTTKPDPARLADLLAKLPVDKVLSPSEVQQKIGEANAARDSALKDGGINLPWNKAAAPTHDNLTGQLNISLNEVMLKSDAAKGIIDSLGTADFGKSIATTGKPDFTRFTEVTAVLRGQVNDFVKNVLEPQYRPKLEQAVLAKAQDAGKTLTPQEVSKAVDAQIKGIVDRVFPQMRGNLFEAIAQKALERHFASAKVFGEFELGVAGGVTKPDNTVLVTLPGGGLLVIFFEYKTGSNKEQGVQSKLRELITTQKDPSKILAELTFDSPQAKKIKEMIDKGGKVQFDHKLITENPGE